MQSLVPKCILTPFISFCFVLAGVVSFQIHANDYVKLSSSGICHSKVSAFYERTKNFKMYATMENCVAAGGRPTKGSFARTQTKNPDQKSSAGYDRKTWNHWIDADGDCQDTRAEILISQSSSPVRFTKSNHCQVTTGTWYDPYSGDTYTNDDLVDIDHIVALGYAHARGGKNWSRAKKETFANDPNNLIAVDRGLNRSKGAAGITEWLPPNQRYRCDYIRRFETIMKTYKLVYFAKEKRVKDKLVRACNQ